MSNTRMMGNSNRRDVLGMLLAAGIVECADSPSKDSGRNGGAIQGQGDGKKSGNGDKVTLLLNWYPEAEHGGFYAALVHGIYEKHGLTVEIKPGGKTTVVPQELTHSVAFNSESGMRTMW